MRYLALAILLFGNPVFAQNKTASIAETVQSCVNKVRQIPQRGDQFYKNFDAYYNPADGTVQNNVTSGLEIDARFQFNKCMVQSGYPLTDKK